MSEFASGVLKCYVRGMLQERRMTNTALKMNESAKARKSLNRRIKGIDFCMKSLVIDALEPLILDQLNDPNGEIEYDMSGFGMEAFGMWVSVEIFATHNVDGAIIADAMQNVFGCSFEVSVKTVSVFRRDLENANI